MLNTNFNIQRAPLMESSLMPLDAIGPQDWIVWLLVTMFLIRISKI